MSTIQSFYFSVETSFSREVKPSSFLWLSAQFCPHFSIWSGPHPLQFLLITGLLWALWHAQHGFAKLHSNLPSCQHTNPTHWLFFLIYLLHDVAPITYLHLGPLKMIYTQNHSLHLQCSFIVTLLIHLMLMKGGGGISCFFSPFHKINRIFSHWRFCWRKKMWANI